MIYDEFYTFNGASDLEVSELISNANFDIPDDYIEFLKKYNGGEGFIKDNYIVLWKASELCLFNKEYEVEKYVEDIFLIGSNGGGEAIAYDLKTLNIVQIPFIGMNRKFLLLIAGTFSELIYE